MYAAMAGIIDNVCQQRVIRFASSLCGTLLITFTVSTTSGLASQADVNIGGSRSLAFFRLFFFCFATESATGVYCPACLWQDRNTSHPETTLQVTTHGLLEPMTVKTAN